MIETIIFVLFSLGQFGRISLFQQEINGYAYEIVYAIFIAYLLAKYRFKPFMTIRSSIPFFAGFMLWLMLTFFISIFSYSPYQNTVAGLYLARFAFYLLGLFILKHHLQHSARARVRLHTAFAVFCALSFVFAVLQYLLYPNLRNLTYLGWDPHQFRIFGTFLDTSVAAALYGLIIIHLIFRERFERFLVIPMFIASLFTYARGFYISLFVTLGYFSARTHRLLQYVAFLIIVLSTIFMLPRPGGEGVDLSRTSSIVSRVADYEQAMAIWQNSPVTGIGYNHIRYEKKSDVAPSVQVSEVLSHAGASFHSSFLIILVTTGIVGLVLFMGLLAQFAVITPVASYMTLFLAVYSLSDNILLHPFILFFYTTLMAYEMVRSKK